MSTESQYDSKRQSGTLLIQTRLGFIVYKAHISESITIIVYLCIAILFTFVTEGILLREESILVEISLTRNFRNLVEKL